jgi:ABC-type transporter Mla MlaB component
LSDSSKPMPLDARQLRFWLATLSPGDLSVNESAAVRPESTMVTGVGSANEALWSQMECSGWTKQITTDALSIPGVTIAYTLTETGARVVTKALAELVSWNAQISELFNSFDLHAAPERVRQLSSHFGRLALRTAAQLAIAKKAKPETEEAQARQRDFILALDEINKGVLTAGQYIVEALTLGTESDAGRDRLERTNKGLRYAEKCLTEWACYAIPAAFLRCGSARTG